MSDARDVLATRLSYAQCWEDGERVIDALDPAGKTLCSIASGGDNTLGLLAAGAERIIALDLSIPQLAVTELKLKASVMDPSEYRVLLGVDPGDSLALYARIRTDLSASSRGWLDAHPELLEASLVRAGRFESYLNLFRTRILPLVHGRRAIGKWFELDTREGRAEYYRETWNRRRWRAMFRVFFSQRVLAARGRSPEHFRYVDGPVSEAFLARTQHALVDLEPAQNPYLQWMLLGRWLPGSEPRYLSEDGQAVIAERRDAVELIEAPLGVALESVEDGSLDGFNLSNVFEYLPEDIVLELLREAARTGRPGSRLAYFNLLVPRSRPDELADRLQPLTELAERLHREDRAFVYSAMRVEEVR
ncbi:MAG: DUF3419 family protein [Proteobacteria bacterium]|nr:DUF3419 family protein [Pseudomonadota bacterium]